MKSDDVHLNSFEKKIYSQFGEDGIIEEILEVKNGHS